MPRAAVYGPADIAKLSTAFDGALGAIREDCHVCSALTAREIRRQVATSILAEAAASGSLDPEHLKEAALHSLERPFADPVD